MATNGLISGRVIDYGETASAVASIDSIHTQHNGCIRLHGGELAYLSLSPHLIVGR